MRKVTVIALAVMASVVLVPIIQAADKKMTGRIVLHYTKSETMKGKTGLVILIKAG